MAGSDVATIWMSRIAMNMPTDMAMKPTQAASGGIGGVGVSFIGDALRVMRFRADPLAHRFMTPAPPPP
jgi:hypothetical protein